MRLKRLVIIFSILMGIFLIIFLNLSKTASFQKRDIVYYNDLLFRVQADLESGMSVEAVEKKYDCTIVMSTKINDPDLSELYRDEALILDLEVNGEYVGKIAWTDLKDKYDSMGNSFFKASIAMWSIVLILVYILLFMIYLSFVRPTKDLTEFSAELAKGNLDVSLPIRRFNPFGGFTEAFDLMREELKSSQARRIETEIARKELVSSLSHDVKTPVAVIEATCEVLDVRLSRDIDMLSSHGSDGNMSKTEGEADILEGAEIALDRSQAEYNNQITESETVDIDKERSRLVKEYSDIKERIATISAKAGTISSLMSDLMHSNLEDSEKAVVSPKEEISTLIEDYIGNLKNYGNIIIKNHIPECLVYMDRQRMEQVIDNIVGNSHKYAGTDIEASFDEIDDMLMADGSKQSFIRITLKDSGPGVSEEDLPLIAQKYYMGANAGENTTGYGLGMYLVKLYMQKMGGDMEYYNDNGFTVRLLLKKV